MPNHRIQIPPTAILLFFILSLSSSVAAQSKSQLQRDQQRVANARKEMSKDDSELRKLQSSWMEKSNALNAARTAYVQAKKKSDTAKKEAEERVAESLGIPAQMLVVKTDGELFRKAREAVVEKLSQTDSYQNLKQRIASTEETVRSGVNPITGISLSQDQLAEMRKGLTDNKRELIAIEDAAVDANPEARDAKKDFELSQRKLKDLKGKINPGRIENDFAYKKAKSTAEQAFKKVQTEAANVQKAEQAIRNKSNELSKDYQSYKQAKQAEQNNSKKPSKGTRKK